MSNIIRYDSLLVRHLAVTLDAVLRGMRPRALAFRRDVRHVELRFDAVTLIWDLDPARGGITRGPVKRERGNVPVARSTRVAGVTAPPDERLIEIALAGGKRGRGVRTIVFELVPNRWNAWALGPDRRILTVLRPGAGATRSQLPGDVYQPPHHSLRLGAREPVLFDEWLRLLLPSPPRERRRRILSTLAYTSPLNVDAILGDAADNTDGEALRAAHARYAAMVADDAPATPCLLDPGGAAQPYPFPVMPGAEPMPGLLEAFEEARRRAGGAPATSAGSLAEEAADRVEGRIRQVERRIARLRAQLDGAPAEAATRRHLADLLTSQLHRVRRGDTHFEFEDFDGTRLSVELDPAISPAENAARLYDQARKRDRAAAALPGMIERATAERQSLIELLNRIRAGKAAPAELEAVLSGSDRRPAARQSSRGTAAALPFRRYRTTGGLEVRVGRGSRANDELTFHHSSPDDIWIHARDVAGAHVVLRWHDRDANPPAHDLAQAAVLAALHSRARTSGVVPVDWTRRKYVRKPRKAPPGRVRLERAQTLFVEPDEKLAESLRWDPIDDAVEPG